MQTETNILAEWQPEGLGLSLASDSSRRSQGDEKVMTKTRGREYQNDSESFNVQKNQTSLAEKVDIKLVKKAAALIEANLENPNFKLRDLTKSFPLEERQLRNKIKLITGLSPKRFQQEIALCKAKRMLENEEYLSIKAVAYSVGMFHVTRFSNLFKSRFGRHPSFYCTAMRSGNTG